MANNISNTWIITGAVSIALTSAAIGWFLNEKAHANANEPSCASIQCGHHLIQNRDATNTSLKVGNPSLPSGHASNVLEEHSHAAQAIDSSATVLDSSEVSKKDIEAKGRSEKLKAIDMTTEEHAYCLQQLNAERAGRTRVEKRLREAASASINTMGYSALPIGKVESPFPGRRGAPRQGAFAIDVRTKIAFANSIPAEALRGLRSFSHVYVIFLFHENTSNHKMPKPSKKKSSENPSDVLSVEISNAVRKRPWQPLVAAPALRGGRTGVFGSRSPHRPNAIGLSLCRIVGLEGCEEDDEEEEEVLHFDTPFESIRYFSLRTASDYIPKSTSLKLSQQRNKSNRRYLLLSGCDLLDGTPILDIKPYGPFDCPACFGTLMTPGLPIQPSLAPFHSNDPLALAQTVLKPRDINHDVERLRSKEQFEAPTSIAEACNMLLKAGDIPISYFSLHGPHWVFSSLVAQAKARLPVVWGPKTIEVVKEALDRNRCKFYGQDAGFFEALHPSITIPSSEFPTELQVQRLQFEYVSLLRAITQVLSLDIRAAHQGRGDLPSKPSTKQGADESAHEPESTIPVPSTRRDSTVSMTSASSKASATDGTSVERHDFASPDVFVSSSSPSYVSGQSYELYFDALHIRFTFREFPTAIKVATTQRWPCYVHVDQVSIVSKKIITNFSAC